MKFDSFKSVHNLHTTPRSQLEAPCIHPLKKKAHSIGIPFIKPEQQQPPRRLSGAVTLNKAHELADQPSWIEAWTLRSAPQCESLRSNHFPK